MRLLLLSFFSLFCTLSSSSHFEQIFRTSQPKFGEKGVFNEDNCPNERANSAHWEYGGSYFLFGGHQSQLIHYGDLWEYSLEINQWRYLGGSKSVNSKQSLGDPDDYHENNYPCSRFASKALSSSYTETIILFGGGNLVFLNSFNDVWEYSHSKSQWRLLRETSDDQEEPIYGNNMEYSNNTKPMCVLSDPIINIDPKAPLFFMGGNDQTKFLNQVWQFSLELNQWRFLKGTQNYLNVTGVYPSPIPTNGEIICREDILPHGRTLTQIWKYADSFYMYGGNTVDEDYTATFFSDMWMYNSTENMWCFVWGTDELDLYSEISKDSVYSPDNIPGQKTGTCGMIDEEKKLIYMFGGGVETTNEMWVFNIQKNMWKFTAGQFGTLETEYGDNPYPRSGQSCWKLNNSELLIFGGITSTTSALNDIWIYKKKEFSCFSIDRDEEDACSEYGECIDQDECSCQNFHEGEDCSSDIEYVKTVMIVSSISLVAIVICIILISIIMICIFCRSCVDNCFSNAKELGEKVLAISKLKNVGMLLAEQELESKSTSGASVRVNSSLFSIKLEQIKPISEIAQAGSGAVIYKSKWKDKIVCWKVFRTQTLLNDVDCFEEFEKEATFLASVSHPNLVTFYGITLETPKIGIVIEWCDEGDLKKFIAKHNHSRKEFPVKQKIEFLKSIADGMEYLHERNVIHRDLKSENVLINSSLIVKIIDFGISKLKKDQECSNTMFVGTNIYMAPEVAVSTNYNEKCDVFSYSIICYETLTQNLTPYGTSQYSGSIERKVASDPKFRPIIEDEDKLTADGLDWMVTLMKKCWNHDYNERPSFTEILKVIKNSTKK